MSVNVENMSLPELRQEIKNNLEAAERIELKYNGKPIGNEEDLKQVKLHLELVDSMEARLGLLEDTEMRRNRIVGSLEKYTRPAPSALRPGHQGEQYDMGKTVSPGDQFIRSDPYRELKLNGSFNSQLNRVNFGVNLADGTSLLEWAEGLRYKTILTGSSSSSGGSFVGNDLRPGYVELLQRELTLFDLIVRLTTESDTVEYVQQDTFTNNAAMTAEASATTGTSGQKPESALAFSTQTAAVRTLAHWIPVTNRMLADAPAIRGIINSQLLLGLNLTLETQMLSGNGSGENFTGILNTSNINIQGKGSDSEMDAIFKARTQVVVNGKGRPSALMLHPNDWQTIRLTREGSATGTYLMGPPSQVGPGTLWGIPVVETQGISENTALVGDFRQGANLFDREQAAIRVGTIDAQFIRNMQTILAELRAAFVVWRPQMFTKITGI